MGIAILIVQNSASLDRLLGYLKVKLDERGRPSLVELDYLAQQHVLVRTKIKN